MSTLWAFFTVYLSGLCINCGIRYAPDPKITRETWPLFALRITSVPPSPGSCTFCLKTISLRDMRPTIFGATMPPEDERKSRKRRANSAWHHWPLRTTNLIVQLCNYLSLFLKQHLHKIDPETHYSTLCAFCKPQRNFSSFLKECAKQNPPVSPKPSSRPTDYYVTGWGRHHKLQIKVPEKCSW